MNRAPAPRPSAEVAPPPRPVVGDVPSELRDGPATFEGVGREFGTTWQAARAVEATARRHFAAALAGD